jgi:hypothetical protein
MSEIANIEAQITDLQELVEKKDLALKLENNREFKKLILDGFCEADCARFARNSGDPAIPKDQREDSLFMAQAAGHLRRWLSITVRMGLRAEDEIQQHQATIEEIRVEGKE